METALYGSNLENFKVPLPCVPELMQNRAQCCKVFVCVAFCKANQRAALNGVAKLDELDGHFKRQPRTVIAEDLVERFGVARAGIVRYVDSLPRHDGYEAESIEFDEREVDNRLAYVGLCTELTLCRKLFTRFELSADDLGLNLANNGLPVSWNTDFFKRNEVPPRN